MTLDEPRYCAPKDFGYWHITKDGETTLCGKFEVQEHHLSGKPEDSEYELGRDCWQCAKEFGLLG